MHRVPLTVPVGGLDTLRVTRIAYIDTFSGISGDMFLGALIDAGLPIEGLTEGLRALRLGGFKLSAEKVMRGAFQATRLHVLIDEAGRGHEGPTGHSHQHQHGNEHSHSHGHGHDHAHSRAHDHGHDHKHGAAAAEAKGAGETGRRGLKEIVKILEASELPASVRTQAAAVFERIGKAEARVHGIPIEEVHFHEVGAIDSIIDITGVCLGLHLLGVDEVWCSAPTVGSGFVHGAHGQIPLPAPATLEILKDIPIRQRESGFELTTPTGAALTASLGRGFGPMPPLTVRRIGYGAGDDRPGPVPNVLRILLGERSAAGGECDRVVALETNVDDMSPQWIGYLVDRLFEAGALDVTVAPSGMKKSRPAHEIRVLAPLGADGPLAEILFRETTTFGIRRFEVDRLILERSFETAETPWGLIRIKVGRRAGKVLSASPEYEDVQKAAKAAGVPFKEVHRRAMEEFHRRE